MGSYIVFKFLIRKEDNRYVSHCQELGVSSSGETIDEAFNNLKDAVEVYLNTIEELGERSIVFKEKGIRIQHKMKPSDQVSRVSIHPDTLFTPYIHYLNHNYAGV